MALNRKATFIAAAAQAAQTLPEQAALVLRVAQLDPTAANPNTLTNLTVVSGTPSAGQVQFTGKPSSPSGTLTLASAATAGTQLLVEYVPVGYVVSNL